MSESPAFQGAPRTGGARDRRLAGLVVVLVIVFLGLAVAKPWAGPAAPAPTTGSSGATLRPPAASSPATGSAAPSAEPAATLGPLAVGFTTPVPPVVAASWTALRWQRLSSDDPLRLVTSVVRWRGGFLALGWVDTETPMTPVWTSTDGSHWEPVPFDTPTTFWPGTVIFGAAGVPAGLVLLTESARDCGGSPCAPDYVPPAVSWTSPDGRTWSPHVLPGDWPARATGSGPRLALGPAGLVAASSGPGALVATSTDGMHWQPLPASALPARFVLNALAATAGGYVAAGRWETSSSRSDAAAIWSADGRHWSRTPSLLPTAPLAGPSLGSESGSLVGGTAGLIAIGRGGISPGATLWWQSPDGRRWRPLPAFPPLGPTTCDGGGCGLQPGGDLVGDGRRLVAIHGGIDAEAWVSSDGLHWDALAMSGDLPSVQASHATLLPGGVLLSDGATTWFGEAIH